MNGIEFITWQQSSSHARVPVVIFTASLSTPGKADAIIHWAAARADASLMCTLTSNGNARTRSRNCTSDSADGAAVGIARRFARATISWRCA